MEKKFSINIGYTKKEQSDYNPFYLDLSKYPVLFIDYNHIGAANEDMDSITKQICSRCTFFNPHTDHVKCVVLDSCGVFYNSVMKSGTYRRDRCDTMLKRLNTLVSRIYDEYSKDPANFMPRTKYIFLVCRIGGLEQELIEMMSKLGPIGVYLIVADDAADFEKYPGLFVNLYGKLTYSYLPSAEDESEEEQDCSGYVEERYVSEPGEYPTSYSPYEQTTNEYVYTLERLRPDYTEPQTIYTEEYYQNNYMAPKHAEEWESFFNGEQPKL